jgi:hypothetical protein
MLTFISFSYSCSLHFSFMFIHVYFTSLSCSFMFTSFLFHVHSCSLHLLSFPFHVHFTSFNFPFMFTSFLFHVRSCSLHFTFMFIHVHFICFHFPFMFTSFLFHVHSCSLHFLSFPFHFLSGRQPRPPPSRTMGHYLCGSCLYGGVSPPLSQQRSARNGLTFLEGKFFVLFAFGFSIFIFISFIICRRRYSFVVVFII